MVAGRPAHAFQMVAAAVAYLLRSVDVGAQAPTPFPVKMPSGHLAQRAARRYRRYGLLLLLSSSFSQENTRLSTNCDSSAAEKKLSPTPLHYPLVPATTLPARLKSSSGLALHFLRKGLPRRSGACPAALRGVLNGEGASATTAPKCTTKVHNPRPTVPRTCNTTHMYMWPPPSGKWGVWVLLHTYARAATRVGAPLPRRADPTGRRRLLQEHRT